MTTDQALQLTVEEQNDLRGCEAVIERGRKTFIEVGAALSEIRERDLYRNTHATFEEYCEERWQIGRNYANKLITASSVVFEMGTIVPILPSTEGQARALAALAPDQRVDVWTEAVARNDGRPAPARLVAEVAAERDGGLMAFAMPELLDEPAGDRREDGTPIVRRNDLSALGSLMGRPQSPAPVQAEAEQAKPAVRNGNEWYTRADDVALVKAVLGEICLDPASCAKANETVGATEFYALERGEDGLALPWNAPTIFTNPPYSDTDAWIKRLVAEFRAGTFNEGIALVLAKTETEWFDLAWEFGSVCIVRSRISHVAGDGGNEQTGRTGSAFFYFGHNHARFADVFAHRGRVLPATPWTGRPVKKAVAA